MSLEWLVGIEVVIFLAVLGWVIVAYHRQSDHIAKVQDAAVDRADLNPLVSRIAVVEGDMRSKVNELHVRINDTQRDYVRRDDFRHEMSAVSTALEGIKSDLKNDSARINQRLDAILVLLGRQTPAAE